MVTQTSKRSLRVLQPGVAAKRPGAHGSEIKVTGALPLDLFRALGDANRIAIVSWLAAQRGAPRTVSDVAAGGCCAVDFSVVSRHLRTLEAAGLVEAERRGREVFYRLRVGSLVSVLRRVADVLESCCPPARENQPTEE